MTKKKVKFAIKNILILVCIVLAGVGLACLAAPVLTYTLTSAIVGDISTTTIGGYGLVFGGGPAVTGESSVSYEGGVSYFALISFILMLLGIVLALLCVGMKKNKILAFVGTGVILVAAIFICLTNVAVSPISTPLGSVETDYSHYSLGAGAYLYLVFGILSSGTLAVSAIVK